jgi:hypothetical protein
MSNTELAPKKELFFFNVQRELIFYIERFYYTLQILVLFLSCKVVVGREIQIPSCFRIMD